MGTTKIRAAAAAVMAMYKVGNKINPIQTVVCTPRPAHGYKKTKCKEVSSRFRTFLFSVSLLVRGVPACPAARSPRSAAIPLVRRGATGRTEVHLNRRPPSKPHTLACSSIYICIPGMYIKSNLGRGNGDSGALFLHNPLILGKASCLTKIQPSSACLPKSYAFTCANPGTELAAPGCPKHARRAICEEITPTFTLRKEPRLPWRTNESDSDVCGQNPADCLLYRSFSHD